MRQFRAAVRPVISLLVLCSLPACEEAPHPDVTGLLDQADSLLVAQDFSAALALLRRGAAGTGPDVPAPIRFALGNTYARMGNLDSAAVYYRATVSRQPDHAEAWHNLGIVLADLGRHQEAVAAVERAVSIDPTLAAAFESLGLLEMKVGEYEKARAALLAATQISAAASPRRSLGRLLTRLGHYDEAERYLQLVVDDDPGDAEAHRLLGLLHLARKDPASAVASLERATRAAPRDTEAFFNLAAAYRSRGDTAGTRRAMDRFNLLRQGAADIGRLRSLLDDSPEDVDARLALATLYRQRGDLQEAIRHLRVAATHAPDRLELQLQLSRLQSHLGQHEQALKTLLDHPHPLEAPWHFAVGYEHLTQRNLDAAEAAFLRATELDPQHGQAWNNLGNVHLMRGDRDAAGDAFRASLASETAVADAAMNLGTLYAQADRLDSAIHYYEIATGFEPVPPRALLALGALGEQAGRPRLAADAYQRFLELEDQDASLTAEVEKAHQRLQRMGTP